MSSKYLFKSSQTFHKYGVDMSKYEINNPDYNIIYEETKKGHFEEFLNTRSTFTWFIIEGKGTFVINDEKIEVEAKDIVSVPPNHRMYYLGDLKMILLTTPAFDPKDERHIRDIK